MSNKMKKILIVVNIVLLFVITGFSAQKEESYKKLDSYFYLELRPVDPRSLLQGDYMTLNYDILDQTTEFIYNNRTYIYDGENENEVDEIRELRKLADAKRAYIAIRLDENKVAKFVKLTKEKTDEKDLFFIAYKSDGYNVDINVNSYLFQEGTGDKYENARYAKVVLVGNKLRLIDLRDKDFKEIK
ncbi:GDYXXLXY domain-containing protein [Fusobacterium periodonticum]|uniref:GDYXXLXY domain-containing protein n=1 Tax=Fusobacterium periodonticum TaxID=860 RepID=UPI0028D29F07|nr:GDYXXLXY domain-containing protein [Fusobacterium periodonticum]